tara:strand:- start:787 stop:1563 length:777 start_codon:yes stop_codon:yes gene_type:complete
MRSLCGAIVNYKQKKIMAVSIDTVYQRVLALANKEQRGYVTPQEYNLLANKAQLLIFEQYFYEIDRALDIPGNSTEYSDRISILQEKIAIFENNNVNSAGFNSGIVSIPTSPAVHKLGTVFYYNGTNQVKMERVDAGEIELMTQTALYAPSQARPVYIRRSGTTIEPYPATVSPTYNNSAANVNFNYIAKPSVAVWGYTVVNNQALYNSGTSTDFELHASEESELVYKILELSGIVLNKPGLVEIAANEDKELMIKKQ